jgi:hypothetical protein
MFIEDRMLFFWARLSMLNSLRDMEADFGIIPQPKFNETQENYISNVNSWSGAMIGVPKIAADFERTSIILEALAAEGYYTLKPAYYDVVLNRKYMRDEESSVMLDIIFGSRQYDICTLYNFGDIAGALRNLYHTENRNVASLYARLETVMQNAIDNLVANIKSGE